MYHFYGFDPDDYDALCKMRETLHNKTRAMTFDEQRDFAERMRLLLERGILMEGEMRE